MTEEDLVSYRRRLPHWRLTGSVYFITWRLAPTQTELSSKERAGIMSALRHFDGSRYDLFAGVVMHDHVHVLIKPLQENRLQDIIHAWKSFTAHKFRREFGRKAPVLQDEYFDRIVRDERELSDKAQYILYNPLKTWPEVEDYPWVWVKQE